jgi:hypothetical protein
VTDGAARPSPDPADARGGIPARARKSELSSNPGTDQCADTEGVTGSIPVPPTQVRGLMRPALRSRRPVQQQSTAVGLQPRRLETNCGRLGWLGGASTIPSPIKLSAAVAVLGS